MCLFKISLNRICLGQQHCVKIFYNFKNISSLNLRSSSKLKVCPLGNSKRDFAASDLVKSTPLSSDISPYYNINK